MKANTKWALLIGLGLALFPLSNSWLTEITSIDGQATLFLPAIGAGIWIMGVLLFINRGNWKDFSLGDRKIYIPLFIIVGSMGISGLINGETLVAKGTPLFTGIALFATYVVARKLGSDLFKMLIPFMILGSIIAVILGIIYPGESLGGLITNYCASAGFLIFAAMVNQGKWQWILIALALIGVFFIGALEAVFILGVLGLTVLIRRDVSKRFLIVVVGLVGLVGLWAVLGYLTPLYEGNRNIAVLMEVLSGDRSFNDLAITRITSGRWKVIVERLKETTLFGYGYSVMYDIRGTVHNLPLIISHQIGPLAAIAWSFVTVYAVIKTKWKYAWIGLMAMGVFDHYIWTQFSPFWWVLLGVSTASTIKSDKIFRRVE